jgi:hypothetical protein
MKSASGTSARPARDGRPVRSTFSERAHVCVSPCVSLYARGCVRECVRVWMFACLLATCTPGMPDTRAPWSITQHKVQSSLVTFLAVIVVIIGAFICEFVCEDYAFCQLLLSPNVLCATRLKAPWFHTSLLQSSSLGRLQLLNDIQHAHEFEKQRAVSPREPTLACGGIFGTMIPGSWHCKPRRRVPRLTRSTQNRRQANGCSHSLFTHGKPPAMRSGQPLPEMSFSIA